MSYYIPIFMILLNCFLVLPYLKYLRHALISTKSAGKAENGRVEEARGKSGDSVGGCGFITHDLDGEARGAIALVVGGVYVVIGRV